MSESDTVDYSAKKTEADMRFRYIDPAVLGAGWSREQIDLEHPYTNGQIVPEGRRGKRQKPKKPDYVLRFGKDYRGAIVEAKSSYKDFKDGIQQAIDYATDLDCKFAYSTNGKAIDKENGKGIYEYDFITKTFTERGDFPAMEELLQRDPELKLEKSKLDLLLKPLSRESSVVGKPLELYYFQKNAINRAFVAMLKDEKKILLNLATGTGKTQIAFQIARKFWNENIDKNGNHPKILFITDRDRLLKQAMDGDFQPFGKSRHRIKTVKKSEFDMYFTLYQSLDVDKSGDEKTEDTELYKLYPKDFFKMIVVDECHRGASTQGGQWRDILKYFDDAVHIGMTATPKRDADSKDTFDFFGEPVYTYSKKKGVEDGFLAPFFLYRKRLDMDEAGYRPEPGAVDRNGRPLEDRIYNVEEFDKKIRIRSRQEQVAKTILDFLGTPPYEKDDKTIIFCTDQQHALEMTELLVNLSGEGTSYCKRITSNEGDKGKEQLDKFCNIKEKYPVIAVTSELMSTGVNAPACKLIVLDKFVNSETQLKQIDGRGTRIQENMDKFYYSVLDFRGSTARYSDPSWDGESASVPTTSGQKSKPSKPKPRPDVEPIRRLDVDGYPVEIIGTIVQIYDPKAPNGKRVVKFSEYTGRLVRELEKSNGTKLRDVWTDTKKRQEFVNELESKAITLEHIREISGLYKTDVFDILMNFAYNSHAVTRMHRVENVRKNKAFFEKYPEKAREVLNVLLDHYAEVGYQELDDNEFLQLEKFEKYDGPANIVENIFEGNFDQAKKEVIQLIYER